MWPVPAGQIVSAQEMFVECIGQHVNYSDLITFNELTFNKVKSFQLCCHKELLK